MVKPNDWGVEFYSDITDWNEAIRSQGSKIKFDYKTYESASVVKPLPKAFKG